MKFGEDLFNDELRPAPSVAAISRSVRSSITAHSANWRQAPTSALRQKRPFTQSPYQYGQTIKKTKGHAGITPHGLCETVPLGPPEIPAHSVRACLECDGITQSSVQTNEHASTNPSASNSIFSNLQG